MRLKRAKGFFLIITILVFDTAVALAQGCDAAPPSGEPDDGPVNYDCPLDTWVYVLVAAAVIFGAYRLYKNNKTIAA